MFVPLLMFVLGVLAAWLGVSRIILAAGVLVCAIAVSRHRAATGTGRGLGASLLFRSGVAMLAGAVLGFLVGMGGFLLASRPPLD